MQRSKGYMIPIVLIVLLLIFAGFVLFSQKTIENPIVPPIILDVSTATEEINIIKEEEEKENATITSEDVEDTQATTSTSTNLQE